MRQLILILTLITTSLLGFSQEPTEKSQMGGYWAYKGSKGEINIIDLKETKKAFLQPEKIFNAVLNKEEKDELKFKK